MSPRELTDEEVFGPGVSKGRELSDADVFGAPKSAKPKVAKPKRSLSSDISGAISSAVEATGFGDDFNAAAYAPVRAIHDAVTGQAKPRSAGTGGIQGRIIGALQEGFDKNIAETRGITKRYREAHPLGGTISKRVGEVAPTAATMVAPEVMLPLKGAQTLATTRAAAQASRPAVEMAKQGLLSKLTPQVVKQAATTAGRYGAAAGRGAVDASFSAGAMGAGLDEGGIADRGKAFLKGATDPLNVALGAVTGGIGGGKIAAGPKRPKAKDFDDLAEQMRVGAKAKYKAVDDMGLGYTPQAVKDLHQGIHDVTVGIEGNVDPETNKKVASILNNYVFPALRQGQAGKGLSMSRIERMRRTVGAKLLRSSEADDRRLGAAITEQIDQFFDAATPAQVNQPAFGGVFNQYLRNPSVNGPAPSPQEANRAILAARGAFQQHAKAKRIADAYHDATIQAASTHAGANATNTMRGVIRQMGKRRGGQPLQGATPAEKKQIQRIARGTPGQNLTRLYGTLSPDRGGMAVLPTIFATAASAATGNPLPLLAAGGSVVARHASQAQTRKEIEKLMGLIANGDPKTAALGRKQLDSMIRTNPRIAAEIQRIQEMAASGAARTAEAERDRKGRP